MNKKKTLKKKVASTLLSFSMENDDVVISKKANPNKPILLMQEKTASYSLQDLKKENMFKTTVVAGVSLDSQDSQDLSIEEIKKIKSSRLKKRNGENKDLKIQQEQEDLEEIFEDYRGEKLVFGENAVKEATRINKEALEEGFNEILLESSDEDLIDWEENVIKKGLRGNSFQKSQINQDFSIPGSRQFISFQEFMKNCKLDLEKEYKDYHESSNELQELKKTLKSCKEFLQEQSIKIKKSGQDYDYYQEFQVYLTEFVEFLDKKEPLISLLEAEFYQILDKREKNHEKQLFNTLDSLLAKLSRAKSYSFPFIKSENVSDMEIDGVDDQTRLIKRKLEGFFSDCKDFSIEYTKEKIEDWKNKYSQDYSNCYGTLAVPGMFEVHVRHELCLWDPLSVSIYKKLRLRLALILKILNFINCYQTMVMNQSQFYLSILLKNSFYLNSRIFCSIIISFKRIRL